MLILNIVALGGLLEELSEDRRIVVSSKIKGRWSQVGVENLDVADDWEEDNVLHCKVNFHLHVGLKVGYTLAGAVSYRKF